MKSEMVLLYCYNIGSVPRYCSANKKRSKERTKGREKEKRRHSEECESLRISEKRECSEMSEPTSARSSIIWKTADVTQLCVLLRRWGCVCPSYLYPFISFYTHRMKREERKEGKAKSVRAKKRVCRRDWQVRNERVRIISKTVFQFKSKYGASKHHPCFYSSFQQNCAHYPTRYIYIGKDICFAINLIRYMFSLSQGIDCHPVGITCGWHMMLTISRARGWTTWRPNAAHETLHTCCDTSFPRNRCSFAGLSTKKRNRWIRVKT